MDWSGLVGPGGATVVGILLFFIYGQQKGWWVSGIEYQRLIKELEKRDTEILRWQEMALNSIGLADQASRQAVKAVATATRVTQSGAATRKGRGHDPLPTNDPTA